MAYKLKFDTGETVSFENQPTDADIEEVVKKLGIKPKKSTILEAPTVLLKEKKSLSSAGSIVDVLKGVGKGIGSTAYGMGSLLEKGAAKLTGQKTLSQTITGKEAIEKPEFLTPQNTPEN